MTFYIAAAALEAARDFLEGAGTTGQEGTGMLAGRILGEDVHAERFFAPEQRAGSCPSSWVEVTANGKSQLALELSAGERWVSRIHSHPCEAFHSHTDDANPGLTSDGAFSIVVPHFGLGLRAGIEACAIHQRTGGSWVRMNPSQVIELVRVV